MCLITEGELVSHRNVSLTYFGTLITQLDILTSYEEAVHKFVHLWQVPGINDREIARYTTIKEDWICKCVYFLNTFWAQS